MSPNEFDRPRDTGTAETVGVVEPAGATAATGPVSTVRDTDPHQQPLQVTTAPERRDRVRWGPVWAGLVTTLSTFLLLELAFFALGWLTLGGADSSTAGWMTGLVALAAFFLGGLTAGATAMWRGVSDGLLHGIMVWALGVVGIVFLTLFGGGALFGPVAEVFTQVASVRQANLPDVQLDQALQTARSAASWAVLSLGLSVLAASLGGVLGAKMWPRKEDAQPHTVDVR